METIGVPKDGRVVALASELSILICGNGTTRGIAVRNSISAADRSKLLRSVASNTIVLGASFSARLVIRDPID
jgi:hypothetical protein